MSVFADRERGFDAKFIYDEERRVRVTTRRNRLLALWAAEAMRKPAAEREAYASEVVRANIAEHSDAAARVRADLAAGGILVSDDEVALRAGEFLARAEQQLRIEDLTTPESAPHH